MRIQDLEKLTGLERATIRYYEREGLIDPRRSENGYRDYGEEDVQQLRKIKLLRQLDFSLEQIQQMRQGNVSIPEAMSAQLSYLKEKSDTTLRAFELCREIMESGSDYFGLNVQVYLEKLENTEESHFRENVSLEVYPLRRFWARQIDWMWMLTIAHWVGYCLLRIRPVNWLTEAILLAVTVLAGIYLEAALVYLTGTTPGKWLLGIRIESVSGRKITWEEALWRAKLVNQEGVGFRIPIIYLLCCIKGYKAYTEGDTLSWEEDTQLKIAPLGLGRKAASTAAVVMLVAAFCSVYLDTAYYPAYRNGQLTIKQYAVNYNSYEKEGSGVKRDPLRVPMRENGEFDILAHIEVGYIREDPVYICNEDGTLKRIEYTGKIAYDQKVMAHLILAAVGAQKDVKLMDLAELKSGATVAQKIANPIMFGTDFGEFTVAGIRITWNWDASTDLVKLIIHMA